jgi:hypothetical protein
MGPHVLAVSYAGDSAPPLQPSGYWDFSEWVIGRAHIAARSKADRSLAPRFLSRFVRRNRGRPI